MVRIEKNIFRTPAPAGDMSCENCGKKKVPAPLCLDCWNQVKKPNESAFETIRECGTCANNEYLQETFDATYVTKSFQPAKSVVVPISVREKIAIAKRICENCLALNECDVNKFYCMNDRGSLVVAGKHFGELYKEYVERCYWEYATTLLKKEYTQALHELIKGVEEYLDYLKDVDKDVYGKELESFKCDVLATKVNTVVEHIRETVREKCRS